MLAYVESKSKFLEDAPDIQDLVRTAVFERLGINIKKDSSEYKSWENSLGRAMFHALNTPAIPEDAGVAIEYRLNGRRQRIDFMISGRAKDGTETLVVIELKQWTEIEPSPLKDHVRTWLGGGLRDTTHPSYQAYSYATLLNDFYETVSTTPIRVAPCAYAHNAENESVLRSGQVAETLLQAPIFLKQDRQALQAFITENIETGDNALVIKKIEASKQLPSKQLVDSLSSMLDGNQEFTLIDEQKTAFEEILYRVRNTPDQQKSVLIIEGGPGTGKSVIAVNALVQLLKEELNARYVTKNAAPREVYRIKLGGTRPKHQINNLFLSSDNFWSETDEVYDVLLVDEAHRLVKHSGFYRNQGENQMLEIIRAAKTAVFFIDESQHVTWRDIGSREDIESYATQLGASVHKLQLSAQFRCAGSDEYISWLDGVLGFASPSNFDSRESEYEIEVLDSPTELRDRIFEQNTRGGSSRLLAGYCWDWVSKKDSSKMDIVLENANFAMRWNLADDGQAWMIAPDSVNQVGCIHTCQGLEGDFMGIIIGPDLELVDGKLQGNPSKRAKTDKSLDGYKKAVREGDTMAHARAEELVRKTYRTLLTRGMKGTFIYATDPAVREFLRSTLK